MITSIKFINEEHTEAHVISTEGVYTTAWPCRTWHNEEIQKWLDAGNIPEDFINVS